ncbi:MAG: hypothetical protein HYY25_13570 [Candidatus Wallbacteria bacterium]|nr:hypothetical protein [Candidatus Wallbacteria bacterium]
MRGNRRATVLLFAVGCMALVAALLAAIGESATGTRKMISRRDTELRAATAAASGLNHALSRLRQRGLRFINFLEPPPDPALAAGDLWIEDQATHSFELQAAGPPHELVRMTYSLRVAPEPSPVAPRPGLGFVRANLAKPARLDSAVRFTLTVTGNCLAADGRVLARKTITHTFVGANVVAVDTRETP